MQSPVFQIRIVHDRSGRERHRQFFVCQNGQQTLHGIVHSVRTFSSQHDTLLRKFHPVSLPGALDFRIEPQSDRSASGNRIAAAAFPQEFVQQGRFVGKSFVRCNRHGRTHGAVSLAECHGFQRGDDIIRSERSGIGKACIGCIKPLGCRISTVRNLRPEVVVGPELQIDVAGLHLAAVSCPADEVGTLRVE